MENLIVAIKVVAPLCIMMALGYGIRRLNLVNDETVKQMNNVTFRIFLPTLLFYNVYQTDLHGTFRPKLTIFSVAAVFGMCLLAVVITTLVEKENFKRGAIVQAAFRSNFVIFGLPVTLSLYGPEQVGVTALLVSIIVPTYNLLCVIVLELFRGQKINVRKIIVGIVTNPLILAAAFALTLLFTGIRLPQTVEGILGEISGVATPLALIILGASFTFSDTKAYRRQLVLGISQKLVLMPLIFVPIGVALGFRNVELVSLLILLGAPTAVSSFSMADQMGSDSKLAGQLIVYSSAFSIITIFVWVLVLRQMALI